MRESNKYPEIILYKNYLYSNDIVDGDYIDRLLLKRYLYIKVAHRFFDKNIYIYSKGGKDEDEPYLEFYDENNNVSDIFEKMTEIFYETGWQIIGFMKDEEGNIL